MRVLIRSGGQTGVDRAAIDFAIQRQIPYAGWCPRGGWAEDQPHPPGLLALYPLLCETPSPIPEQRTAWNVRDSFATLILVRGPDSLLHPGTALTRLMAEAVFLRPSTIADMDMPESVGPTLDWLGRLFTLTGSEELCLNIAGPRESQVPGIYAAAMKYLGQLFP